MEWRNAFCAGMLTSRALIFTSSTSRSSISSRSSGSMTHPRLLKLCRWDPRQRHKRSGSSRRFSVRHRPLLRARISSPFQNQRSPPCARRVMAPGQLPRFDGAIGPAFADNDTDLDVPISRPIIKLLLAMLFNPFVSLGNCLRKWCRAGARPRRRQRGFFRRMHRDCLHDPRSTAGSIVSLMIVAGGSEKVTGMLRCTSRFTVPSSCFESSQKQEMFQPPELRWQIIKPERDTRAHFCPSRAGSNLWTHRSRESGSAFAKNCARLDAATPALFWLRAIRRFFPPQAIRLSIPE